RRSTEVTGINPDMSDKEYMQMLLLPGVVAGALVNPVGTAAGLIAFGALDKAIPTDRLISKMEESGVKDEYIKTVELADFVGKSLIVGGVFHKASGLDENFLKQKITQYK